MLRRVLHYIRTMDLLPEGGRVLVCVSGGADSVALLDVLWRGGYDCVVAHCNFHLRGEESLRDEQAVRRYVADYASRPGGRVLPLYVKDVDTRGLAAWGKKSIELVAREERYRWFGELAEQEKCCAIAVAHHQNDQAETVIMNLKRSAGIRGLCGMRAKNTNAYAANGIPVIRPLLCTTHDYIVHYLSDIRHLEWVEDSTNRDLTIPRNHVRAMLQSFSKAEIEHIAMTAERMQGYVDWMEGKESYLCAQAQQYEKEHACKHTES